MSFGDRQSRRKFLRIAATGVPALNVAAKNMGASGSGDAFRGETTSQKTSFSIIAANRQDPVLLFAVEELQRYLMLITGSEVAIGDESFSHHIYVGEIPSSVPARAAQELRNSLSGLQEDGFVIRSVGPDIALLGKGARGNLHACYAFLERLGARWFFPGNPYEVIPRRALDWNEAYDITESPAFRKRILFLLAKQLFAR